MTNIQCPMSNIQSQITDIQSQLEAVYPADEAEALAWWLVEETTGLSRSQILTGCKDTTNFAYMQIIRIFFNTKTAKYLHN